MMKYVWICEMRINVKTLYFQKATAALASKTAIQLNFPIENATAANIHITNQI